MDTVRFAGNIVWRERIDCRFTSALLPETSLLVAAASEKTLDKADRKNDPG